MTSGTNQVIINEIQIDYNNSPLAIFLIGANGSGKSTLRKYLDLSEIQTNIDPDALNRIFKQQHPEYYQVFAARNALDMYENALNKKLNLCIESTLCGHGTLSRIHKAKGAGYHLIAYFIGLNNPELNIARIANRVRNGGHYIDDKTVKRRYNQSIDNLLKIYQLFDKLYIIDNSQPLYSLQLSKSSQGKQTNTPHLEQWVDKINKLLT